ncbi:MAG: methylenetetrahydrofolate reductase C-terminal domain-containing protein, partial [bacterium]|nr:methylenetetrahydrofolate reductase C-terminal domain-containing protein [bacterium]
MIISQQKPLEEVLSSLKEYNKIFLVGCGECAATCKSGGEPELLKMKAELEAAGKTVMGICMPSAPCVAAQLKTELAKNIKVLRDSEAVLVLACGLGVQSVKDNDRLGLAILPASNTIFGAVMDAKGDFYEKCSMCAECVLGETGGICPVTLCAKGLLNGPCGGMNKGKCEIDSEKDCAWVLIYRELEKKNKLDKIKEIHKERDYKKSSP